MKLYLTRHGVPIDRVGGAILSDSQRPLADEGKKETVLVAQALKKINVKPDLVVSSPLIRAKQTADILQEILGGQSQVTESLCPGCTAGEVYKFLKKFPDADEIFLVGHEPDMGQIAGNMLGANVHFQMPFKRTGVCRIDVADVPPTIPGVLKWFIHPGIVQAFSDEE